LGKSTTLFRCPVKLNMHREYVAGVDVTGHCDGLLSRLLN